MYENEKYMLKMKQDMALKNFMQSTSEDYYRFVLRFLNFTGKEAMSITYAFLCSSSFMWKINLRISA